MCMGISPASRFVPQVCARCPLKPEESIRYLELESQMTMSYLSCRGFLWENSQCFHC